MELFKKDNGRTFQISSHHPDKIDALLVEKGETAVFVCTYNGGWSKNMAGR